MPLFTPNSWDELLDDERKADVVALLSTKYSAEELLKRAAGFSRANRRDEERMLWLCLLIARQASSWQGWFERQGYLIIKRRHTIGDLSCSVFLMQEPKASLREAKPNRVKILLVDVPLDFGKFQDAANGSALKLVMRIVLADTPELHFSLHERFSLPTPPASMRISTPLPSTVQGPVPSKAPPSVSSIRTMPPPPPAPAQGLRSSARFDTVPPVPATSLRTTKPLPPWKKGTG